MKKRVFWITSLVLALAAVFLHWVALAKTVNGNADINQAGNLDILEQQRQIFMDQAHHFYHLANNLRYAGMAVAILGVACLIISSHKNESAPRWLPIIVLTFYLLLQLAIV